MRFRKKRDVGERAQQVAVEGLAQRQARGRPERAEDRAGQPDARLGEGVVAERLGEDRSAEEWDEHGRARADALAAQLEHVAHLVHEQQQHEPGGELPAEEQAVGGDRDERRAGGREQLDLGQQQEQSLDRGKKLGDQGDDRREHAADALAQRLHARAAVGAEGIITGGAGCAGRRSRGRGLEGGGNDGVRRVGAADGRQRGSRRGGRRQGDFGIEATGHVVHCGSPDKRCLTTVSRPRDTVRNVFFATCGEDVARGLQSVGERATLNTDAVPSRQERGH